MILHMNYVIEGSEALVNEKGEEQLLKAGDFATYPLTFLQVANILLFKQVPAEKKSSIWIIPMFSWLKWDRQSLDPGPILIIFHLLNDLAKPAVMICISVN